MSRKPKISDADIEAGLNVAARLVERYGEKYWPVFERLEQELDERRSRAARISARLRHTGKASLRVAPSKTVRP